MLAAGCGAGSDAASPKPSRDEQQAQRAQAEASAGLKALEGTWEGAWQSGVDPRAIGSLQLTWQQVGRVMKGTVAIIGGQCLDAGPILGRVNGTAVDFDIESNQAEVLYSGTVSGDTMAGTYTTSCANNQGTWRATKA